MYVHTGNGTCAKPEAFHTSYAYHVEENDHPLHSATLNIVMQLTKSLTGVGIIYGIALPVSCKACSLRCNCSATPPAASVKFENSLKY